MKVLVVDDEALVRRSLGRALRSKGHDVVEAADGAAGLEAWRASDPDLVFLDVLMPGLTGPQVLSSYGAQRRAKVILMSAFAGDSKVENPELHGADIFIPKPFDDIFEIVSIAERLKP